MEKLSFWYSGILRVLESGILRKWGLRKWDFESGILRKWDLGKDLGQAGFWGNGILRKWFFLEYKIGKSGFGETVILEKLDKNLGSLESEILGN